MASLNIIGAASCWGAQDVRCELGPDAVKSLNIDQLLTTEKQRARWLRIIRPQLTPPTPEGRAQTVYEICQQLATEVKNVCAKSESFVVVGGDHSCAIGTWTGAHLADPNQQLGLIWIDAHMDSHIPETSPSGNLHGMPLACLLGHGDRKFVNLGGYAPKLLPKNICLVGVRSYERGEAALLDLLGVRVFLIDEVKTKGLKKVLAEAKEIVTANTSRYGISIDLDAVDPVDAPGVGSRAKDGLRKNEFIDALSIFKDDARLIGMEITELNPENDVGDKTAYLAIELVKTIYT